MAPERIEWGPFDAAGGRQAAEKILSRRPYPDAIFATNDFAAIGALGVLRDHGLRVPDDIALIGYNDTPLAAEMPTPLTTVRSPMHEMGRRGIELLIELLGGSAARVGAPHPDARRAGVRLTGPTPRVNRLTISIHLGLATIVILTRHPFATAIRCCSERF